MIMCEEAGKKKYHNVYPWVCAMGIRTEREGRIFTSEIGKGKTYYHMDASAQAIHRFFTSTDL
jgi:hypothetical protein